MHDVSGAEVILGKVPFSQNSGAGPLPERQSGKHKGRVSNVENARREEEDKKRG